MRKEELGMRTYKSNVISSKLAISGPHMWANIFWLTDYFEPILLISHEICPARCKGGSYINVPSIVVSMHFKSCVRQCPSTNPSSSMRPRLIFSRLFWASKARAGSDFSQPGLVKLSQWKSYIKIRCDYRCGHLKQMGLLFYSSSSRDWKTCGAYKCCWWAS